VRPLSGDLLAIVFVALGLAARLLAARGPFMPDEAWHLRIASAPDLAGVYRASLESAHPPLFFAILHFWKDVARTDWQLRLLPVAFGAAFLWAAYRWAVVAFGKIAALFALALLAFLPAVVLLSAELRAYGLVLWLLALHLRALERGLARRSAAPFGISALFGALALLTHYGAAFVLLASLLYSAVRIRSERLPPRVAAAWLAPQAALALLAAGLYRSHISTLRGGALEQDAQTRWLTASYFHAGRESAPGFVARQTLALFDFLFSTRAAGVAALLLFALAVAHLAIRRRPAALLLAVPFAATAAAGLAAAYPYGGSRHGVALALFACAGAGLALARASGERTWVAGLLGAVLCPAAFAVGL